MLSYSCDLKLNFPLNYLHLVSHHLLENGVTPKKSDKGRNSLTVIFYFILLKNQDFGPILN